MGAVTERLARAGCVAADEEAAELLAAAPDGATLETWLTRREQGEPLAWIVGSMEFGSRRVLVDPGVYVPRLQTVDLARRAAAALAASPTRRAVDLCTGSGAVAAHLRAEVPTATVVGADIDTGAVRCARRNGVPAIVADLAAGLRSEWFDVVTAVAPYVPTDGIRLLPADVPRYEPLRALDGGSDGLFVVRQVAREAARVLRPGGWLFTEVGGDQDRSLAATLAENGFSRPVAWHDDDGDLRGVASRYTVGL